MLLSRQRPRYRGVPCLLAQALVLESSSILLERLHHTSLHLCHRCCAALRGCKFVALRGHAPPLLDSSTRFLRTTKRPPKIECSSHSHGDRETFRRQCAQRKGQGSEARITGQGVSHTSTSSPTSSYARHAIVAEGIANALIGVANRQMAIERGTGVHATSLPPSLHL